MQISICVSVYFYIWQKKIKINASLHLRSNKSSPIKVKDAIQRNKSRMVPEILEYADKSKSESKIKSEYRNIIKTKGSGGGGGVWARCYSPYCWVAPKAKLSLSRCTSGSRCWTVRIFSVEGSRMSLAETHKGPLPSQCTR